MQIGFVVGLTAEARLLRGTGFSAGVGGGTPAGAMRAAEDLIEQGAGALISFGLAGGLNPALLPGAVLVPKRVVEGDASFVCDPGLVAWLGGASVETMLAGTAIAVTVAEKRRLFEPSNADAIDLESGAVARVALAHGLPFAVLRAVADPAEQKLPPAALLALDGGGRIGFLRVLGSVFGNPGQILGLLALARDAAAARRALAGRVRTMG
jgi:adenosylhomocysteine nucleosidase